MVSGADAISLFQAARYSNGGAYPPDLSLITKARHDGQNYGVVLGTIRLHVIALLS